jgi:hypothetical protein
VFLNQRPLSSAFFTPSAPPSTYTFKLIRNLTAFEKPFTGSFISNEGILRGHDFPIAVALFKDVLQVSSHYFVAALTLGS